MNVCNLCYGSGVIQRYPFIERCNCGATKDIDMNEPKSNAVIDTPRTNQRIESINIECEDSCCAIYVKVEGVEYDGPLVDADFTGTLERELAAMTKERDNQKGLADKVMESRIQITAERDTLRARVAELEDALRMIIRVNSNTDSENEEDGLPDIHECAETALNQTEETK